MGRTNISRLLLENVQPHRGHGGWHGGPTPLGAIRGVSAVEAAWTPARGRKSIWQLTLHIAYWKYAVRRLLERANDRHKDHAKARFARTPSNWPRVPSPASERAWREDIALLKQEHERLLKAIAAVSPNRYGRTVPKGKRWTLGELILGIALHDAYHAGQIQMLKRIWAATRR